MDQNQKKLLALLSTPQGKQLMQYLTADGGTAMRQAGEALKAGNTEKVRQILSPMVESQEVSTLLGKLEKEMKDG